MLPSESTASEVTESAGYEKPPAARDPRILVNAIEERVEFSFDTKIDDDPAGVPPPGKFAELVTPATTTLPAASAPIAWIWAKPEPPKYVRNSTTGSIINSRPRSYLLGRNPTR